MDEKAREARNVAWANCPINDKDSLKNDARAVGFNWGFDAGVASGPGPGEGWTPVSERLPDEDGHFAVTVEPDASGFQWDTTAYWFDNELGWCEANREEYIPIKSPHSIIAWHKLPAPYGKESHSSGPGPRQALEGVDETSEQSNSFWLIERGQAQGCVPPLWWAGGDRWVSDVNEVPAKYRFASKHLAQAEIVIEKEERGYWPWECFISEHGWMGK